MKGRRCGGDRFFEVTSDGESYSLEKQNARKSRWFDNAVLLPKEYFEANDLCIHNHNETCCLPQHRSRKKGEISYPLSGKKVEVRAFALLKQNKGGWG